MGILNSIKKALEPKPPEPQNRCPWCKNDSLVPWVIRFHEGSKISDNPSIHIVGKRCEKCLYTVVHAPWIVFHFFKFGLISDQKMLIGAVERCVIDHREDCIPQEVLKIILPIIKKEVAYSYAKDYTTYPLNTPVYWENESIVAYEFNGKCVWRFD